MTTENTRFAAWCESELNLREAYVVKELSGGNSNLTQLISTDQGPLVLRTPPANTISPKAHRGVERESIVMAALSDHASVPKVVAWCEDVTIIGRPFMLVEHIDGVSITDTLPSAYASVAAVNSLGEQLTDALASIATAPWQELGLESFGNPENFLSRQINRWLDVRRSAAVRELPEIETLAAWLLDNLPANAHVGVVHGDYHLDNALCSADRPELMAVIDWEMATIGDPLTDLGLFLMFWGPRNMDPPGFRHVQAVSRVEGVLSRQVLADRWASKTGIDISSLNFYLCFAFWRLAAIVEGAYKLYVDGKVDTPYARGLEYDVPALLAEAQLAAKGEW
ncbi:MAG: aminoglycoside phosphotransferase (APT) family kinase protein [Alcanivorax sp.]|jgi:aminoglycoside phosphotransferase (APT) family kinase protein